MQYEASYNVATESVVKAAADREFMTVAVPRPLDGWFGSAGVQSGKAWPAAKACQLLACVC
jgi:hypothetical protein